MPKRASVTKNEIFMNFIKNDYNRKNEIWYMILNENMCKLISKNYKRQCKKIANSIF